VPRQNGKNALIEIVELFKMVEQSADGCCTPRTR
jgi:hypothetical protein